MNKQRTNKSVNFLSTLPVVLQGIRKFKQKKALIKTQQDIIDSNQNQFLQFKEEDIIKNLRNIERKHLQQVEMSKK